MMEYDNFDSLSFLFDALDLNDIIKNAVIIQKVWRGYKVRKLILIVPSFYHTKNWRKNQKWYINGKHNECEIYQLAVIRKLFNMTNKNFSITKTNERINFENNSIVNVSNVFDSKNPFALTENFDCKIVIFDKEYYFNLKFVVGCGGIQTRSLREVYHFIIAQFEYKLKYDNEKYIFNILDGDECHKKIKYLKIISSFKKYEPIKDYIFIGDMFDFQKYYFSCIK